MPFGECPEVRACKVAIDVFAKSISKASGPIKWHKDLGPSFMETNRGSPPFFGGPAGRLWISMGPYI